MTTHLVTGASASISFTTTARAYADPATVAPPSDVVFVQRVSPTWPAPTLDSRGLPVAWQPSNLASMRTPWGRLRVLVGGVDVTYFRGITTLVESWSSAEPFGDKDASLHFGQLHPFEALPSWLADWAEVEIRLVRPDNSEVILWEGNFASDEAGGIEQGVQCIGAMYLGDLALKWPSPNGATQGTGARTIYGTGDIGQLIAAAISDRPWLGLLPLIAPPGAPYLTGIGSAERGSFNPLVTGYMQDLLASAWSTPYLADGETAVDVEADPTGSGYWLVGSMGTVIPFGIVTAYHGSMLGIHLNAPATGIAPHPSGEGYWYAGEDGGVFTFNATFFGSLGDTGNPNPIVDIEATPSGNGYWLADKIGGVFAFGDASFLGSLPGSSIVVSDVVDFCPTPSGNGYYILGADGGVFCYGDAVFHGNELGSGRTFAAIEVKSDNGGYWLVATSGEVYAFGTAVHHGNTPMPLNQPAVDISRTSTDGGYYIVALDGGVFALGDAVYQGNGFDGRGEVHQWTVTKIPRRQPVLKVKDRKHVQWHVAVGSDGVEVAASRDLSQAPTAIYGEGIAPDHGKWRNSKYPGVLGDSPAFPGTLDLGATGTNVTAWENQVVAAGYSLKIDGVYDDDDASICRQVQAQSGLTLTGKVDSATWDATFNSLSGGGGSLTDAYVAPLFVDSRTEPYTHSASGAVTGTNPAYDAAVKHVERYENFGDGVDKVTGTRYAQSELIKDSVAPFVGSMTLSIDPEEGSRFEIKAGDNIVLRYFRGSDRQFHIADVSCDWGSGTVTLSIDEHARDSVTLAAIRTRDKSSVDPSRRVTYRNRKSKQTTDDRAVWDAESGAGFIPHQSITANTWKVIKVAAGEFGSVVGVEFSTDVPAQLSAGIFDRPVDVATLNAAGPDPLGTPQYWDVFDETTGLIIAWGQDNQPGGYYPGALTDSPPAALTGQTRDNASWYYASTQPPWLWLAVWVDVTTAVSGRLFSAPEGA